MEYRPAGAGFRVEMPGKAQISNEDIKTDVGQVPTTTAVVELGTTVAFVVMHSNYTEQAAPTGRTPETDSRWRPRWIGAGKGLAVGAEIDGRRSPGPAV